MFAPTIDHPDYGVLFVAHHRCPFTDSAGERQLIMAALKLIRRLDPAGFEGRRDTEALRARLDALAVPAGRQPYTTAFDAIAAAVARVDPAEAAQSAAMRTFELGLRGASDAELLYRRLAVAGEIGRRGERLRAAVEAELARRPWVGETPGGAGECEQVVY